MQPIRPPLLKSLAVLYLCVATLAQAADAPRAEGASAPAFQNTPRLRALDFTPFEAALAKLTPQVIALLDAALPAANVSELQEAMAQGQLTSEALTLYLLRRIRQHDERLRTYLELNPHALDEARRADADRAAGRMRGPLHGIPVSLKDNIETAGPMHTTAGAELLLNHVAGRDAPVVAQLRAGGAVILGKANLSEFAGIVTLGSRIGGSSAVGGQTINPHGAAITGGSSAGSAAGVAARLAVVSVGTETSGSLITPSAWNGVVGMKPSLNLVNGAGVVPLLRVNDSPGPIGRSVVDVAALLDVIDTRDVRYAELLKGDALDGVTVGILAADITRIPGNPPLLQTAAAALAAAGARLRPVEMSNPVEWGGGVPFGQLLSAGARLDMMGYVASLGLGVKTLEDLQAYDQAQPQRRQPFGAEMLALPGAGPRRLSQPEADALAARLRQTASAMLDAAFASKDAQVLVSIENLHSTIYATAGYPAVTVPLGLRASGGMAAAMGLPDKGVPAGITFIGKRGDDARLLAFAYAFERASGLRVSVQLP